MIDVHPPHKTIGNTSEFFLHLFTITIGLLIAVGIEGCVERYEHHRLAEEARQTMTAEIRNNAKSAGTALAGIKQEQKRNADELASVQKIQLTPNDPTGRDLNLSVSFELVGFDDTAWKTAQATGALGFMPYAEAERYSDIYDAEQVVEREQDQIAEDETQMLGVAREVHPGQGGRLTGESANAVAKQLGIIEGHLLTLKLAARLLQAEQDAFLEGKESPHNLSATD
jgi:hypothetical protein